MFILFPEFPPLQIDSFSSIRNVGVKVRKIEIMSSLYPFEFLTKSQTTIATDNEDGSRAKRRQFDVVNYLALIILRGQIYFSIVI